MRRIFNSSWEIEINPFSSPVLLYASQGGHYIRPMVPCVLLRAVEIMGKALVISPLISASITLSLHLVPLKNCISSYKTYPFTGKELSSPFKTEK